MIDPKLNTIGRYFWMLIAGVFTVIFFIYSYNEGRLTLPFLMPLVALAVWETIKRFTGREVYYYPKNLVEYVVENALFFGLYIVAHLFLKGRYAELQAVYIVALIGILAFDTYAILKVHKTSQ